MDDFETAGCLHHGQWRAWDFVHRCDGKPQIARVGARDGVVDGFTKRYGVKRLVWFEFHADFVSAIAREKQLKKWNRAWKMELIESGNPEWLDLWQELE